MTGGEDRASPASVVTGDLRWGTIGELFDAFGALARSAEGLMALDGEGADPDPHRRLIDEFVDRLATVSAAVEFAAAFLDPDQRRKVRERFREERNKMQHAHWRRFPPPDAR